MASAQQAQPFRKVQLETADGHLVHRGWMPTFIHSPVAVLWGQRMFRLADPISGQMPAVSLTHGGAAWQECEPLLYRECFCFAVVDLPDLPAWEP